jgi:hypothetical protein
MLIACAVFAYSLNCIGMILLDFTNREKEMKENLYIINNYMESKKVSGNLQFQII